MKAALLYIPALLLVMAGCAEREDAAIREETVPVHFRIGTGSPGSLAASEDEMAVNNLQMMVFDAEDSLIVDYVRFDDLSRTPSIRIEKNKERIVYAAANIPDDFGDVSSIADLCSRTVAYRNESLGNMQMMGNVSVCAGHETTVNLSLKRFVAKISMNGYRMRTSCTNNCVPEMKRICLLAIPERCYCDFSEYSDQYFNISEGLTEKDLPFAEIFNPPDHIDEYEFLTSDQSFTFYGYPNSIQEYGNNKYPRLALVCIGTYHRNNSSVTSYCYHILGLSLPPLESNLEYRIIEVITFSYGPNISITPGDHPVRPGFLTQALEEEPLYVEVRDMSTGLLTGTYPIKDITYYEEHIE